MFFQSLVWTLIDNNKSANQIARLTAIVVKIRIDGEFFNLYSLNISSDREGSLNSLQAG